jgi:hypothetical protein
MWNRYQCRKRAYRHTDLTPHARTPCGACGMRWALIGSPVGSPGRTSLRQKARKHAPRRIFESIKPPRHTAREASARPPARHAASRTPNGTSAERFVRYGSANHAAAARGALGRSAGHGPARFRRPAAQRAAGATTSACTCIAACRGQAARGNGVAERRPLERAARITRRGHSSALRPRARPRSGGLEAGNAGVATTADHSRAAITAAAHPDPSGRRNCSADLVRAASGLHPRLGRHATLPGESGAPPPASAFAQQHGGQRCSRSADPAQLGTKL